MFCGAVPVAGFVITKPHPGHMRDTADLAEQHLATGKSQSTTPAH